MEERTERYKTYRTDLPYPVPVLSVNVEYRAVQKPSGVAYILLELINNSSAIDGSISYVLKRFGIPEDLHYIFGNEIVKLVNAQVIKVKPGVDTLVGDRLGVIKVSDLVLTENGEKMFTDGAIPTGEKKYAEINVAYDNLTKQFSKPDYSLRNYAGSELSFDDTLMERVTRSISRDELGEYIENNKTGFGLKKEELITKFTVRHGEWKLSRAQNNLGIAFDDSGMTVSLDTDAEKAFFNEFYGFDVLRSVLRSKPDFNFKQGTRNAEIEYGKLDADEVFIPRDIRQHVDGVCSVYIARKDSRYVRSPSALVPVRIEGVKADNLLSILGTDVLFACLEDDGECRFYVPYSVTVPCLQFNDEIKMDLVGRYSASEDLLELLLGELKNLAFGENESRECGNLVAYLEKNGKGYDGICHEYVEARLSRIQKTEDKITLFIRISEFVKGCPSATSVTEETGRRLYTEYIADSTVDTVGLKYQVLQPLLKLIGISDKEFLDDVLETVRREGVDDVSLFNAFESVRIKPEIILSSINVVRPYVEKVLRNEPMTGGDFVKKFDVVRTNLWKLNDRFHIKSPTDYVPSDETFEKAFDGDFNEAQFLGIYSVLEKAYKDVSIFRDFAGDEYSKIDEYLEIYTPVSEAIKVERDAQKSAKKINEKYIDNLINKGSFRDAVCSLYIAMQLNLKKALKINTGIEPVKLIDAAFDGGIVDDEKKEELNRLRICRNDYQHANTNMRIVPDTAVCNKWKDLVFSFGKGGKK